MPRVHLYEEKLPYAKPEPVFVSRVKPADEPPIPPPVLVQKQLPADAVFATSVLSQTRILATCYWSRSSLYGSPLTLIDFDVEPLTANSWSFVTHKLDDLAIARRARTGKPLGVFVESEIIASQLNNQGASASLIPAWLVAKDSWSTICQSAAGFLASGAVSMTQLASAKMEARPFLDAAGVAAGPRGEDPAPPAFLYGVVIALDEAAANNPKPPALRRSQRA